MKTHHYILLTTALFILLFYNQSPGLNLGILSVVYAVLTFFRTPLRNRSRTFMLLMVTTVLSGTAFAWYGDFPSFLAVVSSLLLLGYRSRNRRMKILLLIPVVIVNFFTSFCRVFSFDEWLPKRNMSGLWQKILAFIFIPLVLVSVFFGIYAAGSDRFASLFTDWELDIDIWQLFVITMLGFFIAFNYWNYTVERLIYKNNRMLENNFREHEAIPKPTYSFLDLDSERISGAVSLFALNILLVFFIIAYNYEQFYEQVKTPVQLSEETHEQVNAVIVSIIMSIFVIMFYFKSGFNFDPKARFMKVLAKTWIVLNAVLVISAMLKNSEYIIHHGFTYKRLGVYAFLTLSLIGLVMTFIKIHFRKKNAFLFNTIAWYLYGTILICSYINWGGIITAENSKRRDFALNYHLTQINFSENQLLEYAAGKQDTKLREEIIRKIQARPQENFFSWILYYKNIR
ncbi:DUF4153 domain-containing protein [uncultured Chryseobacterium sp.]|uniref:DUF4153 domain-containing protein n=1 Tax=uncultured Chryseobacterium sp. TaxID=259322 RepID=UPI0025DE236E|nr:DUF4173 domain-containing protein [uncultured Chryseobacterium sp.]